MKVKKKLLVFLKGFVSFLIQLICSIFIWVIFYYRFWDFVVLCFLLIPILCLSFSLGFWNFNIFSNFVVLF